MKSSPVPAPEGSEAGSRTRLRRAWPPRAGVIQAAAVGVLTVLVAFGYSVFEVGQYHTYRVATDDTVIFDQAVRSYAHFRPGTTIMIGYHLGFGPHFSILGNHFSPILMALAPLYWIHDSPVTLLLAQGVLFALAIPPLWVFTRRALGGGRLAVAGAYLVAAAYALSWPIASALAFNFHEVAFAPLLTAVALERLQAGRLRVALAAIGLLLLVKEDMGLLVAGIGLYLAAARPAVIRRPLVLAGAFIIGGVAFSLIATDLIIPAFGGKASYYWEYGALGSNVQQAALHLIIHPLSSLRLLITPREKLDTMLWLFGAFCFLPLLSPYTLITVPVLAERMFATDPTSHNWWATGFQYNAYLVIVLACAAVDGSARLDRIARWVTGAVRRRLAARGSPAPRQRWIVGMCCTAVLFAAAVVLVPRFAYWPGLHRSFYRQTPATRAVAAVNAHIPSGVTVAALNVNGTQLSGRDTVLLWDGDGGTPPLAASWVVARVRGLQFTFRSIGEERQRVTFLENHGYQIVFRRGGYLLLHQTGRASAAAPAQQRQ